MRMLIVFLYLASPVGDSQVIPHLENRLSQARDAVAFSKEEIRKTLAHGPWPPAPRRDPGNPVSGKPEAIAFGERLFFEPRLSGTGSVLCASCHVPYRGFQDGRPRGFGLQELDRNTPTLMNVGLYRRYGWDGANDKLWVQSVRPLLQEKEMRATSAHVAATVRKLFAREYLAAFGREPAANDEAVMLDAGKALAAYQETLLTRRTPFDDFRDGLSTDYPLAAQRGLRSFVRACSGCHAGPTFSSGRVVGGFRVPALRNVALTAPYMHDGSLATLRDVVRHHFGIDLSPDESDDLVAFLESLTDR